VGHGLYSFILKQPPCSDNGTVRLHIPSIGIDHNDDTICSYPSNNCFETFHIGTRVDPQETFPSFLNHNSGLNLVRPYLASSALAQAAGKPFIMFETNSATCGGLPGISNSFGAGLWAVDYGLTMAAANFSGALLHVGGQNVYYNVCALKSLGVLFLIYRSCSPLQAGVSQKYKDRRDLCSIISPTNQPERFQQMDRGIYLLFRADHCRGFRIVECFSNRGHFK
jgi:hypothetical protein